MARVQPVRESELSPSVQIVFERHIEEYNSSISNTKATLGHSVLAFEVYMKWYPLYLEVERILGRRLAYLYAFAISNAADCQLCIAYFRKIITDAGENPENLFLTPSQRQVVDLGVSIARYHGHIRDHVYEAVSERYSPAEMVVLVAFAGQMVATNVFNNTLEIDIDPHLVAYVPAVKYS